MIPGRMARAQKQEDVEQDEEQDEEVEEHVEEEVEAEKQNKEVEKKEVEEEENEEEDEEKGGGRVQEEAKKEEVAEDVEDVEVEVEEDVEDVEVEAEKEEPKTEEEVGEDWKEVAPRMFWRDDPPMPPMRFLDSDLLVGSVQELTGSALRIRSIRSIVNCIGSHPAKYRCDYMPLFAAGVDVQVQEFSVNHRQTRVSSEAICAMLNLTRPIFIFCRRGQCRRQTLYPLYRSLISFKPQAQSPNLSPFRIQM